MHKTCGASTHVKQASSVPVPILDFEAANPLGCGFVRETSTSSARWAQIQQCRANPYCDAHWRGLLVRDPQPGRIEMRQFISSKPSPQPPFERACHVAGTHVRPSAISSPLPHHPTPCKQPRFGNRSSPSNLLHRSHG